MISFFKKYFIPHEGNDHHPHILRDASIGALLVIVLIAQSVFVLQMQVAVPGTSFLSSVIAGVVVLETNEDRQQHDLASLEVDPLLTAAAQAKADDMAAKGYFAHVSPDGKQPWDWLKQVGYPYEYAGENLAVNFTDSKDVENAWMNSPEHRANILSAHYDQIGIATAEGMYQGNQAIFVVQFFGDRKATVSETEGVPALPVHVSTPPTSVTAIRATAFASTSIVTTTSGAVKGATTVSATGSVAIATKATTTAGASVGTSSAVLGASIDVPPVQQTTRQPGAANASQVLSLAATKPNVESAAGTTLLDRIIGESRHSLNALYAFLAALIALSLIMYVIGQGHKRKPQPLVHGLLVIAILVLMIVANNQLMLFYGFTA